LTVYWESRDKNLLEDRQTTLLWAPSKFVPAAAAAFVNAHTIVDYKNEKDGKGTYVVKGATAKTRF
jgi:hypothetical protein